jgi:hypothetical protein
MDHTLPPRDPDDDDGDAEDEARRLLSIRRVRP